MNYNSKIIIACDFDSKNTLYDFLKKFNDEKLFLKLGMQILYKEGFSIINECKKMGHHIFIDLKLHDIPTTVENGLKSLKKYEPHFITVHALGGEDMLAKGVQVFKNTQTKLLAITVLTSMNNQDLLNLGIQVETNKLVDSLMNISKKSGITGVVCSPHEANISKKYDLISVTPGIRPNNSQTNDQERIMTPSQAIDKGSDFLVIGRPITQNLNPLATYKSIQKEIGEI